MEFPKVLICAPQHESKNYIFDEWSKRVNALTYPNYDVFLADNSPNEDNLKRINEKGIRAVLVPQSEKGLKQTIADAHNRCRKEAIEGGYEYILHLETDIIPPLDVIERLLSHNKKICAGTYDVLHGSERKAMIQTDENLHKMIKYRVFEYPENAEPLFFDGTVKKVFHAGLGCVLIHVSVLARIPFRYEAGLDYHPDTFFALDCFHSNTDIYVDTNIYCDHHNRTWLDKKEVA